MAAEDSDIPPLMDAEGSSDPNADTDAAIGIGALGGLGGYLAKKIKDKTLETELAQKKLSLNRQKLSLNRQKLAKNLMPPSNMDPNSKILTALVPFDPKIEQKINQIKNPIAQLNIIKEAAENLEYDTPLTSREKKKILDSYGLDSKTASTNTRRLSSSTTNIMDNLDLAKTPALRQYRRQKKNQAILRGLEAHIDQQIGTLVDTMPENERLITSRTTTLKRIQGVFENNEALSKIKSTPTNISNGEKIYALELQKRRLNQIKKLKGEELSSAIKGLEASNFTKSIIPENIFSKIKNAAKEGLKNFHL